MNRDIAEAPHPDVDKGIEFDFATDIFEVDLWESWLVPNATSRMPAFCGTF
ncbi:MAG TPA: hypothetical protein ACFCUC_11645 [Desulfobacterales bacterium]